MSEVINQVECPVGTNVLVERFNTLQSRFGALHIIDLADNGIFFRVSAREYFMGLDGSVREVARACQMQNRFSDWIQAVSRGGVRDADGVVRVPSRVLPTA